ncbi:MAG TPA: hypothetical protein VFC77_08370, partial [Myxococcota bacterium]|nr:hypothetical protein [Myxococcota bacterium]
PKNEGWLLTTAPELAKRPTRGIHDALVKLAADKKKEMRLRAISMLARLRTKESVTAASAAILAEKDGATRREAASTLFSVEEIFRRCDAAKSVEAGLADKDSGVRYVYAMVSPRDLQAAIPVLRADGLKASDHHVRESAALELGQRGDGSGESLLITLLARDRMPGVTDDRGLEERLLTSEQVAICEVLGKLGSANGKAALQKATASKLEPVRKAAEKALAAGK